MAAIDKIYVNTWEQYLQFKEWCEQQPLLIDKYGKSVKITEYLYKYSEKWNTCHPIFNAPYYVDAYVIRNCPLNFIQEELMSNYGHWSQERIKSYYEDVKNWNPEDGKCPYWAKLEDFIVLEDGSMTIKDLKESDYSMIKRGYLYYSPITSFTYIVGKHFKCLRHPKYMYNSPYGCKYYTISITIPSELPHMWYHKEYNSWDFYDEFVSCEWCSSSAHCKTIRALKRLMIKWKFPVGTKVIATGIYNFDTYEFIIKK